MKITENQLREMVKKTITSILRENEEDIEIADDWYGPDEFDSDEIEEPTDNDLDMGDDFLDDEIYDAPSNQDKKDKVDSLMRSILAKQGYSGERLERELEKRRTKDKPDASTRGLGFQDEFGGTDFIDDFSDLYESNGIYMKNRVRLTESDLHRIVKESVKRIIDEAYDDFATNHNSLKKYSSDFDTFLCDNGKINNDRRNNLINAQEKQYLRNKGIGQRFTNDELEALKSGIEPLRDYTLPDAEIDWIANRHVPNLPKINIPKFDD